MFKVFTYSLLQQMVILSFSSSDCSIIIFFPKVNEDVGWCKLTTPDGAQQLIQIRHPGIYERYK